MLPRPWGYAGMSIRVFLSTVSDEFRAYRDQLRSDLTRHNVEVKVQEDFKALAATRSTSSMSTSGTAMRWCISSGR
jgi:hypothetical protein